MLPSIYGESRCMNDGAIKDIWNPSTGIMGLEAGWEALAASEISGIRTVWRDQQERLKGTNLLSNFTERLSREWAIETGILENLYDIDRGVTQTLIEQGFREEILTHGSTNQPREFVLQLLNDQKQTLEGIFDFVKDERPLSTSYIKELHAMLLSSTLYKVVQVSAYNRPIASSPANRPEGFPPTRCRTLMLKNTRPPTDVAVPLPKRR